MDNSYYKAKYIKYKNKYLLLKKGGGKDKRKNLDEEVETSNEKKNKKEEVLDNKKMEVEEFNEYEEDKKIDEKDISSKNLFQAIKEDNIEIVKKLLDNGADIFGVYSEYDDDDGYTIEKSILKEFLKMYEKLENSKLFEEIIEEKFKDLDDKKHNEIVNFVNDTDNHYFSPEKKNIILKSILSLELKGIPKKVCINIKLKDIIISERIIEGIKLFTDYIKEENIKNTKSLYENKNIDDIKKIFIRNGFEIINDNTGVLYKIKYHMEYDKYDPNFDAIQVRRDSFGKYEIIQGRHRFAKFLMENPLDREICVEIL
jgi:hypothetical protein